METPGAEPVSAMGVAGFDGPIPLADGITSACVLLVDGLGAELLDAHAGDAPVLATMRGRALQVGFPSTTAAGLAALPLLEPGSRLVEYQPYWAARAELHARLGETAAAREAYDQAIALEIDPAVRRFLQKRRMESLR